MIKEAMYLTENITLKELTKSESAARFGISNEPTEDVILNLQSLAANILQPVRNHFDKPLIITSGFRSPELCVKIGSTTTSQHTKGQAADFEIGGIANKGKPKSKEHKAKISEAMRKKALLSKKN